MPRFGFLVLGMRTSGGRLAPAARLARIARWVCLGALVASGLARLAAAETRVTIDVSAAGRRQVIDGFGTCLSGNTETSQTWWQELYYDDLGASMLRLDLTPRFKSPFSDHSYYSPWFRGRNQQPYALNFEIDASRTPRSYTGPPDREFVTVGGQTYYNGPEGNRARTYTNATDYGKTYAGFNAPIAVMGPNIDDNIARAFVANPAGVARAAVAAARARDPQLARFKLIGALWSPAPWLKIPSGNVTGAAYGAWPNGATGTPFPYIAVSGNFVGGRLDVSEVDVPQFDDSALPADVPGGPNAGERRGPTSALTQFARCTAAYLRALQQDLGTRFYAISIQNELNFETFYNSCTYPRAEYYIKAVRRVRAELDKYEDLRGIRIMGPEDLLGDGTYALWQLGNSSNFTHKNLQYLQQIEADPQASRDVAFYNIHGYASDGTSSSGAEPMGWERWARGWNTAPAAGLPASVRGFTSFGKKSWMTETSGEREAWLWPATGFPRDGAFSIALKIHQALTTGEQSAWLYWQFTDGRAVSDGTLTDATSRAAGPKLVAARHFFRTIRPGAVRLEAGVPGTAALRASAYLHEADRTLTVVLVNTAAEAVRARLERPASLPGLGFFEARTSSDGALWQPSTVMVRDGAAGVTVPGYGVVTLTGRTAVAEPPPAAGARLTNLSVRTRVAAGQELIVGFGVAGATRELLLRAVGPGLAAFGVPETLEDPRLQIYAGGVAGRANDDWAGVAAVAQAGARTGAFGLDAASRDAAMLERVSGTRTLHCAARTAGTVLIEVYDAEAGGTSGSVANLSARNRVTAGDTGALIAGFAVGGSGTRQLLVRAVGAALGPLGVPDALADPTLEIFRGSTRIGGNDDWGSVLTTEDFDAVGAFALGADAKSAALKFTVEAGQTYTAVVRTRDGREGEALVEVYEAM